MSGPKGVVVCGSLSRFPVSLGRAMHEAGYAALGLDWVYVPFACVDLAAAVAGMRGLSIRGLGVSMPFKIEVMPLLDQISEQARRIGAVNTIVNDGGMLTGHNTDAVGALRALEEVAAVRGARVLLLGAGGAARAVAVSLCDAGARVTIANRDEGKARALAAQVGASAASPGDEVFGGDHEVIVNATSVGMADVDAGSPVPASALRKGLVVMDIVYKPIETALVKAARQAGATVVTGERMLMHQALEQFRLYTGVEGPRGAFEKALAERLG